jgi:GntR family transcriptional regulator, transcriptional repressor for pyruvate dehydrogenase complex
MVELTRIHRPNIKDLALEQLKRYIASGHIKPGGRLPSERELAERLGVGRSSIREALKVLQAVGLVEARIGEGTFITTQMGASLGKTMGLNLAAWGGAIIEIMDARRMFEVEAARAAAIRATPADLQALEIEVQRMEATAEKQPREYLAADMNFHRLVGQATQNALAAQIIINLIDMLEEVLLEIEDIPLYMIAERNATHREMLDALTQRNPEAAASAMHRHQQFAGELWQAVISLGMVASTREEAE